jgi:hypothetical protein
MSQETLINSTQVIGQKRLTYSDLLASMPESNQPCELWDGELVMSPAPSFYHQEIVFRCW